MADRPLHMTLALRKLLDVLPNTGPKIIEYIEDLESNGTDDTDDTPVNLPHSKPITGSSVPSSRHPYN